MFKENSELRITKLSSGREPRIVPFAIEAEVKNGSDLADSILSFTNFNGLKEEQLKFDITDNWGGLNSKRAEDLEKDLKNCKLKITIKIELEKYE